MENVEPVEKSLSVAGLSGRRYVFTKSYTLLAHFTGVNSEAPETRFLPSLHRYHASLAVSFLVGQCY